MCWRCAVFLGPCMRWGTCNDMQSWLVITMFEKFCYHCLQFFLSSLSCNNWHAQSCCKPNRARKQFAFSKSLAFDCSSYLGSTVVRQSVAFYFLFQGHRTGDTNHVAAHADAVQQCVLSHRICHCGSLPNSLFLI